MGLLSYMMPANTWLLHREHPKHAKVRDFCGFPDFGFGNVSLDKKTYFWAISKCSFVSGSLV